MAGRGERETETERHRERPRDTDTERDSGGRRGGATAGYGGERVRRVTYKLSGVRAQGDEK